MSVILDAIYADFSGKAAKARNLTVQQIDAVARGRIWSGKDALSAGLIDKTGGINTAIVEMRNLLELSPEIPIRLVGLPGPTKFEQFLITLQQQGIDILEIVNWLVAARATAFEQSFLALSKQADVFLPPVGILQMPAWRIAD